jgi:cytochrome c5
MIFRFFTAVCLLSTHLFAQDGGQLFTLYCSACHGADGKGAADGAFPPLAGSAWIKGDAKRPINIVLHGMEGPIDVLGKTYNLAMPPQGAALPDDQIAAILTFVRSSWGNAESAVTADEVKAVRTATEARSVPWTAPELTKEYPLPLEKTALSNLISSVYHGTWENLPDFTRLKPVSTEEEHSGIIDVAQAPKDSDFGIVWTGDFQAPAKGNYSFLLDADDGARLTIGGKVIAEINDIGPMNGSREKKATISLEAGSVPVRVEYFQGSGNKGITLGWKGPQTESWQLLSREVVKTEPTFPEILIQPTANHSATYRNFIEGATPRAIGFGFPGGVNLAYSADHLTTELIWTGKFMDGGRHWTDRGQGFQPPAGTDVIKLSNSRALPENARARGYKLDEVGNPTFISTIGEAKLADAWKPSTAALIRKISLTGGSTPVEILVSDLFGEISTSTGEIPLGPKATLKVEGAKPFKKGPKIMIRLAPGESATLTYRWN